MYIKEIEKIINTERVSEALQVNSVLFFSKYLIDLPIDEVTKDSGMSDVQIKSFKDSMKKRHLLGDNIFNLIANESISYVSSIVNLLNK